MFAAADTELIATIAVSLSAALLLGCLARRLRLSPIVGYMMAGVLVGPHTPGFVADAHLTEQLAEIGIALLMFGVGLHFSLDDLVKVRRIALPGAIGQSLVATAFGIVVALSWGWTWTAGAVFGMALSVASTVVLVRGLTDLRQLHSLHGHVAIGWLVVEDLFTVLILVALPVLAGAEGSLAGNLLWTAVKIAGLAVLYVAGSRIVPWFLIQVSRLQSRELFTLAVLGVALGVAYGSSVLLSVSMALGAFLGGMIVGRSELSHQAAADALPLRDAFAVLFFVAVGMLFDPGFLVAEPVLVLATLAIILVIKPLSAFAITLLVGYPIRTGLTVAAGLGQIGEFSFIVGGLGKTLGILPEAASQAIVAAALISIALNPLSFRSIEPLEAALRRWPLLNRLGRGAGRLPPTPAEPAPAGPSGHVVLCGHGRTGSVISRLLRSRQWPVVVIEQDRTVVARLRHEGITAIHADAASEWALEQAGIARAKLLITTMTDPLATRQVVDHARRHSPTVEVVARIGTEVERHGLAHHYRVDGVLAEQELAIEMARRTMHHYGVSQIEAQAAALDLRRGILRQHDGAKVLEVRLHASSPSLGRPIADLGLGQGILIMAIDRGGTLLVPGGRTELQLGDVVLLVTTGELAAHVQSLF